MEWLANLCFGCWALVGLGLFYAVLDRTVYSLLNAKKIGEKPENLEEE